MKSFFLQTILISILSFSCYSQSASKSYSKDIALYRAKFFLIEEVLGSSEEYKKMYIDPLAASNSSEITSIYYESDTQKGLLLGFFDDYWSAQSGTSYQGYAFKNINYEKALILLDKIEQIIEVEKKYLNDKVNENNIYFQFDDMFVIIYLADKLTGRIRIKWNGFDGDWENTAFRRTKRRFEKSLEE